MLLTTAETDANPNLSYSIENTAGAPPGTAEAYIKACNPTDLTIDDDNTHFSLLVIDAQ